MLLNFLAQWSLWWSCNFSATNKRNQINAIFWFCLFFALAFQLYAKLIRVSSVLYRSLGLFLSWTFTVFLLSFSFCPQPYLRALHIAHYKWKSSIRYTWNLAFFVVAIVFLCAYQKYYLADNLYFKQNGQNYYRSYENLLFYTTSNQQHQRCSPFNAINLILLSFYIVDALYNLNERAYGDAINKSLACSILVCFDQSRWDFSIHGIFSWTHSLYIYNEPKFTDWNTFRWHSIFYSPSSIWWMKFWRSCVGTHHRIMCICIVYAWAWNCSLGRTSF